MDNYDLWLWIRLKTEEIYGQENTYDYLPDLDITDFAFVGGFSETDRNTKTNVGSIYDIQIDAYTANWRDRKTFVNKVEELLTSSEN